MAECQYLSPACMAKITNLVSQRILTLLATKVMLSLHCLKPIPLGSVDLKPHSVQSNQLGPIDPLPFAIAV